MTGKKKWRRFIRPGVAALVLAFTMPLSGCAGGKDVSSPEERPPSAVEGGATGGAQESRGERFTVKGGLAPTGGVVEGGNYRITPAGN